MSCCCHHPWGNAGSQKGVKLQWGAMLRYDIFSGYRHAANPLGGRIFLHMSHKSRSSFFGGEKHGCDAASFFFWGKLNVLLCDCIVACDCIGAQCDVLRRPIMLSEFMEWRESLRSVVRDHKVLSEFT